MNKDLNNNIKKMTKQKPKLRQNTIQLSDSKKEEFGYDTKQSVIDVEQAGYAFTSTDDILHTYGIDPCCGLVIFNDNVRMLFHLDGSVSSEDILNIINDMDFTQDTKVYVIPGSSCGIDGSFDYQKIEEIFRNKGYDVKEQRIPATFGFVTVEPDKIIIGTGADRSLDIIIPIKQKERDEIEDLFIEKELTIENNIKKKNI